LGWYQQLQEALKAKTPQASPISLQVFESVVNPHLVGLEKSVDLIARSEAQNRAKVRLRKPSLAILIRNE
jgi:hypothetical protein